MGKKGLTRAEWEDLCRRVWERDLQEAWRRSTTQLSFVRWLTSHQEMACVARFLDPHGSGKCSGRLTFNHVHGRGEAAMGMKAADNERHLVTVCEVHHGFSRVGGGWANTKAAIELERTYLEGLYP